MTKHSCLEKVSLPPQPSLFHLYVLLWPSLYALLCPMYGTPGGLG